MEPDLARHPYFEPWTDPQSGVVSYVLRERVAPLQQSLYFTNPSVSSDERWLWLYTAFPPHPKQTLGVVSLDPDRPLIRHFPQVDGTSPAPLVLPEGDAVYVGAGPAVWRLDVEGRTTKVCELPADYLAGRHLFRLATHLTCSADGRYLLLDGHVGNVYFAALGDVHSGTVRVLKEFANNHNHGQFSPVDPSLFLLAHDHTRCPLTGRTLHFDQRIWLLDVNDTRYEGLTPHRYCKPYHAIAHEWWSRDGKVCYVDYDAGAFELDLADRRPVRVWPEPLCHAHCDSTRRYWCADESPYKWAVQPCQVLFYDRQTGRRQHLVTAMPPPVADRRTYHIDPHPQFSPRDTFVVYTTTACGGVDVALCPTAPLCG